MAIWPYSRAKANLDELIKRAQHEGPQTITRHGTERVVVLSVEDYRPLTAQRPDFRSYLLGGPKLEDFTIARSRDTGRPASIPACPRDFR